MSSKDFDQSVAASRTYSAYRVMPGQIRADHQNNAARAPVYSLLAELPELAPNDENGVPVPHPAIQGDAICFSRTEVLARLASFIADGQRTPIKVHRTNTGQAHVAEGFLRHLTGLYAEVTGVFESIPGVKQGKAIGLRCDSEEQPKTPEDRIAAAFANRAENETLEPTPIDTAWLVKRLMAMGVGRQDVAKRLNVSDRTVLRLLELLSLPIPKQMAIREGRLTMAAALRDATEQGLGTAKGARAHYSVRRMRVALDFRAVAPPPTLALEPEHAVTLIGLITGENPDPDTLPESVREWAAWMQPEKAPKPPKAAKPPRAPREPKPKPKPRKLPAPNREGARVTGASEAQS